MGRREHQRQQQASLQAAAQREVAQFNKDNINSNEDSDDSNLETHIDESTKKTERRDSTTLSKEKPEYSNESSGQREDEAEEEEGKGESEQVYPKLNHPPSPSAPEQESEAEDFKSVSSYKNESHETKFDPPVKNGQLQLSKYRDPQFLSAIDHLTSIPYQLKSLFWPAMKIAARSLYNGEQTSLRTLFADLNPRESEEKKAEIKKSEQEKQKLRKNKSWAQQMAYFCLVGIPSAILVGLVYGLLQLVANLMRDIYTLTHSSMQLLGHARSDISYFNQHPELRPTQDQAVNAITDQVVMPYARTIIRQKLGPVKFMAGPADFLLNKVVRRSANNISRVITWASGLPTVQRVAGEVKNQVDKRLNKGGNATITDKTKREL